MKGAIRSGETLLSRNRTWNLVELVSWFVVRPQSLIANMADTCFELYHIFINTVLRSKFKLIGITAGLLWRALSHDMSKLRPSELFGFSRCAKNLKTVEYGSEGYKSIMKNELSVVVDKHYKRNKHHPEHHMMGVSGMDIVSLIEMVMDWKAAAHGGDIQKSIDHSKSRFGLTTGLIDILRISV